MFHGLSTLSLNLYTLSPAVTPVSVTLIVIPSFNPSARFHTTGASEVTVPAPSPESLR